MYYNLIVLEKYFLIPMNLIWKIQLQNNVPYYCSEMDLKQYYLAPVLITHCLSLNQWNYSLYIY